MAEVDPDQTAPDVDPNCCERCAQYVERLRRGVQGIYEDGDRRG